MPTGKAKTAIPNAADFGQLRAGLARAGVSQAQINAAVGTAANGRTRAQICEQLREWMRSLPAATPVEPKK